MSLDFLSRERKNKLVSLLRFLPDETYLKLMYRLRMGEKLNLDNPVSYNEKVQWLKLHDRKPIYRTMVDKYEVKDYLAGIIGDEYIVPTLGIWDRFEDIDFDSLPDQFVLKCTHDSGGLVVCKNKNYLDLSAARKKINSSLKLNFYWVGREWPYKDVKPRIIAEPYLEDELTHELRDYKFYTFNGIPKLMMISSGRQSSEGVSMDYYDMDGNHVDVTIGSHGNAATPPDLPLRFDLMKELTLKLSVGTLFLRVDFYVVNGKVYIGELTFYTGSGYNVFKPKEWNDKVGEWLKLPI